MEEGLQQRRRKMQIAHGFRRPSSNQAATCPACTPNSLANWAVVLSPRTAANAMRALLAEKAAAKQSRSGGQFDAPDHNCQNVSCGENSEYIAISGSLTTKPR